MRLIPIDEESLPRESSMACTVICVLLDAFLYQANDKMLV